MQSTSNLVEQHLSHIGKISANTTSAAHPQPQPSRQTPAWMVWSHVTAVTPQEQRWEWYRAAEHRITCTAGTPNSTVTTGAGINRRDMAVVWPHHDKHYYVAYHKATTCYELQQCNNVNQSAWQKPNMKTKPHCNLVCGSDMRSPK
jgi:hypothetical protein